MKDHRARRPLRAAAVLALGLSAVALPSAARAQFFGGWGGWDNGGTWDGLAPRQVRRAIAERGFRVLAPLRRNGSVFVADVVDQRGQRERLIVAAADAQILQRFLLDDGRVPRPLPHVMDDGQGFAARGTADERGLIPPADIPEGASRLARPVDRDVPSQRFGDLGAGGDDTDPGPDGAARRGPPPIRTVKPRPRVVDRAPEASGGREPGSVEATPLAPSAQRPMAVPAPVARAPAYPAAPAAAVASRPEPAAAPSTPASPLTAAPAPAAASRRRTDPLAIPEAAGKPVRSVASGITGTPVPTATSALPAPPAAAPKSADVPVAPLD